MYFQQLENARNSKKCGGKAEAGERAYDCVETQLLDEDVATEYTAGAAIPDLPPPQTIDWKRSDIYSLGATMYHLLTGKRPSERADENVPISKIGKYDENLVQIIERSMRPDPSERFASAKELADAVHDVTVSRRNRRKTLLRRRTCRHRRNRPRRIRRIPHYHHQSRHLNLVGVRCVRQSHPTPQNRRGREDLQNHPGRGARASGFGTIPCTVGDQA